jgi:hypothetical protein
MYREHLQAREPKMDTISRLEKKACTHTRWQARGEHDQKWAKGRYV